LKRPTVEEKTEIARIIKEVEEEEEFIEIRTVEEMVSGRFHKYFKMFEKKESTRKT